MTAVHRVDYTGEGLSEAELAPTPWQQATRWVEEADARAEAGDDVPEPRALSVATVDVHGAPNVRTVLMRFFDERGPGFVTSRDSTKGARTVLARLGRDSCEPALTLPSGGDTSYAGLVWHDGLLWVSYYSSHEGKSSIYLARVKLP